MNGSENGYSGALFFSLISLGALLKVEDIGGWIIGAVAAIFAAISLRRAFVQSAQATEEDHQRIEIQLQQLWSKVNETSAINVEAMNSVTDAAQLLQENLQVIRVRLAELDNLTQLNKNSAALLASVGSLEENSSALNAELEKIFSDLERIFADNQPQNKFEEPESADENFAVLTEEIKKLVAIEEANKSAAENFSELVEEIKNLAAIEETNKTNLQTVLKLLQLIGQMMKNPAYKKELDKVNQSLEKISERAGDLNALKTAVNSAQKNIAELVKINGDFYENLSVALANLRGDDNALSEQDINLLKKIAAKINLK